MRARVPQGRHGLAFLIGLVMDVADAGLMGQHTMAWSCAAVYAAAACRVAYCGSRCLRQALLQILVLLYIVPLVQFAIGMLAGGEFPRFGYFLWPLTAAVLWAPLTFILLPQYQPVDRDANRPI